MNNDLDEMGKEVDKELNKVAKGANYAVIFVLGMVIVISIVILMTGE